MRSEGESRGQGDSRREQVRPDLQRKEAEERRRREAEEESLKAAVDNFAAAQRSQVTQPGQDPSGDSSNPWQSEATGVKDPKADYTGEACGYFTRPMVRPDGGGLNTYADNSAVCYGERMYKCEGRRWRSLGRCDMYSNWEKHRAEFLEGHASNP